MANSDLHRLTIAQAGEEIKARRLSPVELTQAYLDRISSLNDHLGAYITVTGEQALSSARKAETQIQSGRHAGPLHGVPVAVKDIISTKGVLTSAGSKVLTDNIPDHDSTIIERLNSAGAPILGKLNLSEFAIGGTIEHPYGTPRNPWNTMHSREGPAAGRPSPPQAGLPQAPLALTRAALCGGRAHSAESLGFDPPTVESHATR